jgi:CubicO group peptidase (beta-lactamase class C family)
MKKLLIASIVLVIWSCGPEKPDGVLTESNSDLKIGQLVGQKTLAAHAADTFKLELSKDAFVYGYADQHTVDVMVSVFDPNKKEIAKFDGPARGKENFKFATTEDGIYTIAISPFEDGHGEYSIKISGAEALAKDPAARIDQAVRVILGNEGKTPGIAIAVQRDGKLIYDKGFGYADLEQNAKVTPTTIFHIASVSKQFTSFAIAMLADQGKLSIDDDIRKYLPEIHDFGTPITINHLIHHTSGLRDQWSLLTMSGWRFDDVITTNQILRVVSRQTELNFKPGEEYVYCNTGFTLMGEIVKRVTHEPFPDWCKKNIFDPLGMKNTLFFDDHERIVENRSNSYYSSGEGYKKRILSYANAGATSLFTTVEDLSLWAQNFENVKVGNDNVMKMMNQKFVLNNGDTIDYAFGQEITKYKGLTNYAHGGGDAGFRTFLLRFPEQHFSVSLFSNYASVNTYELSHLIADIYLENEFNPEQKKENDNQPNNNNNSQQPPFDAATVKLTDYAGEYYSPELLTTYWLELKNDTLVSHHQRHDDMRLVATKADGFHADILGDLAFYRENGKIAGFRATDGRVRNLKFVKK